MIVDETHPHRVVVRRHIRAQPARVFAAWTEPQQLLTWWGPAGVVCTHAEVDLQVGGGFRLANQMPDGSLVWISGTYEEVTPPDRLRHTWLVEPSSSSPSSVTVTFEASDGGTEVVITHDKVIDPAERAEHKGGWVGCLEELAQLFTS